MIGILLLLVFAFANSNAEECFDLVECIRSQNNSCPDPKMTEFNKLNCRKTCGYCTPDPTATPNPNEICADRYDGCIGYVQYEPAFCQNPILESYVVETCRKTCRLCNNATVGPPRLDMCVDAVPECAQYSGICVQPGQEQYVEKNCRKTCGFCRPLATTTPMPMMCDDQSLECSKFPAVCNSPSMAAFVKENCKKTCGHCNVATTRKPFTEVCFDNLFECQTFPDICNEPTMNAFVQANCRRTCGFCKVDCPPTVATGPCVNGTSYENFGYACDYSKVKLCPIVDWLNYDKWSLPVDGACPTGSAAIYIPGYSKGRVCIAT